MIGVGVGVIMVLFVDGLLWWRIFCVGNVWFCCWVDLVWLMC